MRRSPGVVIIVILLMAAMLIVTCPAHALFTFPVLGPVDADPVAAGDKTQSDDEPPSRNLAIDESYNGKSFSAFKNEMLIVQLKETDPGQSWRYTGQRGFSIVDDTVLMTYPALHDFRVKVRGPGDLMFAKVDRRSGDVVERFSVHVIIAEPEPKGDIITRYPLYDFNTVDFSPGLLSLWR